MTWIIILVVAVLVIAYLVMTYNALIAMIEAVKNNERQIDIQLDRRYKVFESLINVVRKYMDYEQSTLKQVVALRGESEAAKANGDSAGRMDAENKISGVLGGINAVFEQYPDLKANNSAMQLQEEIVNSENKLAYAKQAYNDSIETYNARKKSFFTSVVVGAFGSKLNFDFPYWKLDDTKKQEQEDYTVKL